MLRSINTKHRPLMERYCDVVVETSDAIYSFRVHKGSNLRDVLLENGLSPYTKYTRSLNCGGLGICATCGVEILTGAPPPVHWHDQAAAYWGYPRLSCQVHINQSMRVRLLEDKLIWGKVRK